MELQSARELKLALKESVILPTASRATTGFYGTAAQLVPHIPLPHYRSLALGIARKKTKDFVLAVRVQQRMLENGDELERIRKKARAGIEVRYIGKVGKCALPWFRRQNRPLRIGSSVGHFKITAGTIGCFVRSSQAVHSNVMILSNNHVLANENCAKNGDAILQPGNADKGRNPDDAVGRLERFVRLQTVTANRMDCAVAVLNTGIESSHNITGIENITGVDQTGLYEGEMVWKLGRRTGRTEGRITAFEMDDLVVGYDPFAQGGESGSLVINKGKEAVGLVFATSDLGGTNVKGLTYANPLPPVLKKLNLELLY